MGNVAIGPGLGIVVWITHICAGAVVLVGLLLVLPPIPRLRRVWYWLAIWIAVATLAVRFAGFGLLPSGNEGHLIPPLLIAYSHLLIAEIGLACYIGRIVRRPVALALLSLGLLFLARALP